MRRALGTRRSASGAAGRVAPAVAAGGAGAACSFGCFAAACGSETSAMKIAAAMTPVPGSFLRPMPLPAQPAALHQVLVGPVARTGLVTVLALVRVLLPVVLDRPPDGGLLRDADVMDRREQENRLADLGGVLRKIAAQRIDQLTRPEQRHPARGVPGPGRLDEEIGVLENELQRVRAAQLAQDDEQAVTGVLLEVSGVQTGPRRVDDRVLKLRHRV